MIGPSNLKIIIGDRNDNKHYEGHQKIVVYNYKGYDVIYDLILSRIIKLTSAITYGNSILICLI